MPLAILLACLNGSENVNADLQAGLFSVYFLHNFFLLELCHFLLAAAGNQNLIYRLVPFLPKLVVASPLWDSLQAWAEEKDKLKSGAITLDEYDSWRYNYLRDDHSQIHAHVMPQELSDAILEGLQNGELTVQEKPVKRKTRKNFQRKGFPDQQSEE